MASVLHQVLVTGVFHADLHPGNVVVTPEHSLVLLDLGSVGVLDRELRGLSSACSRRSMPRTTRARSPCCCGCSRPVTTTAMRCAATWVPP
ncbi:AarF/UbiB family protein [Salana multivorans]